MRTYLTSRNIALVVAGALLIALPLSQAAYAITDTIFKYTTAKTAYYTVHNAAYASDGGNAEWSNDREFGAHASGGGTCGLAGVNLPEGAVITAITAWVNTTVVSGGIELFRQSVTDGTFTSMGFAAFPNSGATRKAVNMPVVAAAATIDNGHFSYGSRACVFNQTRFHGIRIKYTYTTAGD